MWGLLALAKAGGRDALFSVLVGLHVLVALVGFGSIAFAGNYAAKAARYVPRRAGSAPPPPVQAALGLEVTAPAPGAGGGAGVDEVAGADDPAQAVAVAGAAGAGPAGAGAAAEVAAAMAAAPPAPGAEVDPEAEELFRYFAKPARLWWALLAVPWLGMGALAADPHGGGLAQAWSIGAFLIWLLACVVAGGLVVPALGQVRALLARAAPTGGLLPIAGAQSIRLARVATLASRGAAICDVLFFGALALMIWRP
jgi:hypothetical protein